MQFYTKNESGEYAEATSSQLEEYFRSRSDKIVQGRIEAMRQNEIERVKPELEKTLREELTKSMEPEIRKTVEAEFQTKLDEANKTIAERETTIRQKTIAAEYGFKAGTEKFLGTGTEEEMRANADELKQGFIANSGKNEFPDKHSRDEADGAGSDFIKLTDQQD